MAKHPKPKPAYRWDNAWPWDTDDKAAIMHVIISRYDDFDSAEQFENIKRTVTEIITEHYSTVNNNPGTTRKLIIKIGGDEQGKEFFDED